MKTWKRPTLGLILVCIAGAGWLVIIATLLLAFVTGQAGQHAR
jgi:hypothetical protein